MRFSYREPQREEFETEEEYESALAAYDYAYAVAEEDIW